MFRTQMTPQNNKDGASSGPFSMTRAGRVRRGLRRPGLSSLIFYERRLASNLACLQSGTFKLKQAFLQCHFAATSIFQI